MTRPTPDGAGDGRSAPLGDLNLFRAYPALGEFARAYGAGWATDRLERFGALAGSVAMRELGDRTNREVPRLVRRADVGDASATPASEIEFAPAHHEIMRTLVAHEVGSLSWRHPTPGATVAQMALHLLAVAPDPGSLGAMSMTYGAPAVLSRDPGLLEPWRSRLLSREYDPRNVPVEDKTWAVLGVHLTERHSGSELSRPATQARPLASRDPGEPYRLTGRKVYCSGAHSDAFVTLARTAGGPTAFVVPRWLPDGTGNDYDLVGLQAKMGNRSSPTAEIAMDGTWARMLGGEGEGLAVAARFKHYLRMWFSVTPAGLMRHALVHAIHFARERRFAAAGLLVDQPLTRNVLADLAIASEAATALVLRIAQACDAAAGGDERAACFARLAATLAKYWLNKRAVGFLGETLELFGATGYLEDSLMSRFFREIHCSVIGDGPSNALCLDVLAAVRSDPGSFDAVVDEIRGASDRHPAIALAAAELDALRPEDLDEWNARLFTEQLAVALVAAVLFDVAPRSVARAYADSRLVAPGRTFGILPSWVDVEMIIERALPTA